MPYEVPKSNWEQKLREAATQVEEEVKQVIQYINDQVVPDIRRNGSDALRSAAAELARLAQRMDDHARTTSAATPPPPRYRSSCLQLALPRWTASLDSSSARTTT